MKCTWMPYLVDLQKENDPSSGETLAGRLAVSRSLFPAVYSSSGCHLSSLKTPVQSGDLPETECRVRPRVRALCLGKDSGSLELPGHYLISHEPDISLGLLLGGDQYVDDQVLSKGHGTHGNPYNFFGRGPLVLFLVQGD